jgi:hypothetical protein
MNFLQSLTHSFEEDLAAAAIPPPRARPSNMHNEDDYDYAIELRSEEEYRFAFSASFPPQIDDQTERLLQKVRNLLTLQT